MEITEKDLREDIEGFPIEVVQKMIERQVQQGNKADIKPFQKLNCADYPNGGFKWEDTPEGFEFWEKVINIRDFDTFFKMYPKSCRKLNTTIKIRTNKIKLNFEL